MRFFNVFFSIICPKSTRMKNRPYWMVKKVQNISKSPKNEGFRGTYCIPPFYIITWSVVWSRVSHESRPWPRVLCRDVRSEVACSLQGHCRLMLQWKFPPDTAGTCSAAGCRLSGLILRKHVLTFVLTPSLLVTLDTATRHPVTPTLLGTVKLDLLTFKPKTSTFQLFTSL